MRASTLEVDFVFDRNRAFAGISLGFDFAAEHESGIKELKNKFNFPDKPGLQRARTNPFRTYSTPNSFSFTTREKLEKYSDDPRLAEVLLTKVVGGEPYQFKILVLSRWDERDLQVTLVWEEKEVPQTIETIKKMLEDKDFTLGSGKSLFGAGSLCLLKFSSIPKEHLRKTAEIQKRQEQARKKFSSSDGLRALKEAQQRFREENQFEGKYSFHSTPFDHYALSPSPEGKIWLNPANQSYLDSHWLENEDLLCWAAGKPGKVIRDEILWSHLVYECKMHAWDFRAYHKFFSGKPAHSEMYWKKGEGQLHGTLRPFLAKTKPTKKDLDEAYHLVEGFVKSQILFYLGLWDEHRISNWPRDERTNKPLLPRVENLRDSAKREVEGLLYAVGMMGRAIGLFPCQGASNTPTIRENWAWWQNVLQTETEFQIWRKHKILHPDWAQGKFITLREY